MHFIEKNLLDIKEKIERASIKFNRDPDDVKLIVVTKKFDKESIKPLWTLATFYLVKIKFKKPRTNGKNFKLNKRYRASYGGWTSVK